MDIGVLRENNDTFRIWNYWFLLYLKKKEMEYALINYMVT